MKEPHQLSDSDRAIACAIWQDLVDADSAAALEAAQEQLKEAPLEVQKAISLEIVNTWVEGRKRAKDKNPFL